MLADAPVESGMSGDGTCCADAAELGGRPTRRIVLLLTAGLSAIEVPRERTWHCGAGCWPSSSAARSSPRWSSGPASPPSSCRRGTRASQLFENAAATAAGLFAIILIFGPVSGGHFNPVVSFVDAAFGACPWRDAAAYLPAQVAGCAAGAVVANVMFSRPRCRDLDQAPSLAGPLPLRDRRHPRPAARDLRPGASRRSRTAPCGGGRLHRGRLLLHQLHQLRQPGHHRRTHVVEHLRRDRPNSAPSFVAGEFVGAVVAVAVITALFPGSRPGLRHLAREVVTS